MIADRLANVLLNENPGPDEIACRSAAVIGVIPTVTIVTFCKVLATAAAAVTSVESLKSRKQCNCKNVNLHCVLCGIGNLRRG